MIKHPLPAGTCLCIPRKWTQLRNANPGLVFHRYPVSLSSDVWKKDDLGQVASLSEKANKELFACMVNRWERIVLSANSCQFRSTTRSRLILGLGSNTAFDVGFDFNLYGFPIIHGSSLKGLARTWALIEVAYLIDNDNFVELEKLIDQEGRFEDYANKVFSNDMVKQSIEKVTEFRTIYGTTDLAGGAIFFDAIPESPPQLEVDILNPHYPDYYQGGSWPTDDQDPKPTYFITIGANQRFKFAIGWQNPSTIELQNVAKTHLKNGLSELGLGAKTSAGYGYFGAAV